MTSGSSFVAYQAVSRPPHVCLLFSNSDCELADDGTSVVSRLNSVLRKHFARYEVSRECLLNPDV
jgi:hypothetical protein